MKRLMRYEMRRLRKSTSFYVTLGINVLMALVVIIGTKVVEGQTNQPAGSSGIQQLLGVIGGVSFTTVLGIFSALFVTDDYSSGAVKNIVSRGYSRVQIAMAKYFSSLIATFISTFVCWAVAFLLGTAFWGAGSFTGETAMCIVGQIVGLIGIHALYFMISNSLSKNGVAIAINIVGPTMISTILGIVDMVAKLDKWRSSNFFVQNIPNVFASGTIANDKFFIYVGIAVAYAVICIVASIFIAKKKEF